MAALLPSGDRSRALVLDDIGEVRDPAGRLRWQGLAPPLVTGAPSGAGPSADPSAAKAETAPSVDSWVV